MSQCQHLSRQHVKLEKMKPRLILFDLYKTLIDMLIDEESAELWKNLAFFLGYNNIHIDSESLQQSFFAAIEVERENATLSRSFPEIDMLTVLRRTLGEQEVDEQTMLCFLRTFRAFSTHRFGVFNDVFPTLERLKANYRLGLVSNAHRIYAEPEMKMLRLDGWWDVVVMSSDHGISKPEPKLFHIALNMLNIPASDAIYIGDSLEHDVIGARSAGMKVIHIDREQLLGGNSSVSPDWRIASLKQLFEILS